MRFERQPVDRREEYEQGQQRAAEQADRAAAADLAERLRRTVEDLPFTAEGRRFRVTISLGVASVHGDGVPIPQQLVRRADECLYRAKREGRNRVAT